MPTSYLDQFFIIDPGAPPAGGTALTVQKYALVDSNDDNWISTSAGDTVNGVAVTSVWVNDTITVVMNGITVTITGITFYLASGPAVFTPSDGTVLDNATFLSSTYVTTSTQTPVGAFGPPCFVAGTLILTDRGERPVERLRIGDLVMTRDQGAQPVRWIGMRRMRGHGDFAPIRIGKGVFDNCRELLVSPQHRVLVSDWRASLYFGEEEVLVAAKHLVDGARVHPAPCDVVTYVHVMFDRHQIIRSEGVDAESFLPGATILQGDAAIRAELGALFPELAQADPPAGWSSARRIARGPEVRLLAS